MHFTSTRVWIDRPQLARSAKPAHGRRLSVVTRAAQVGDSPPAHDTSQLVQTASRSRQTTTQALTIGSAEAHLVEAFPTLSSNAASAASDSGSPAGAGLLRGLTYAANGGVLLSACLAAASGSGVLDGVGALHAASSSLHDAYLGLLSTHPIALKVRGIVGRLQGAVRQHLLRNSRLVRSQRFAFSSLHGGGRGRLNCCTCFVRCGTQDTPQYYL